MRKDNKLLSMGAGILITLLMPLSSFAMTGVSADVSSSVVVGHDRQNDNEREKRDAAENQSGESVDNQEGDNQINASDKNDDEQSREQADINQKLKDVPDSIAAITVNEYHADQLHTYGDVVAALNDYLSAVQKIQAGANVQANASSTLNAQEQALLAKLLGRHRSEEANLTARTTEITQEIKQLVDLLTPLANQPIADFYGLKALLVSQLNDFKDQINGLGDLAGLHAQEISDEAS